MRYLVRLKPLEPFMFGGEQTFGALGDKEVGSYLVKSRMFPQQTAILGMVKRELMTQAGVLTRKRRGEWVDSNKKVEAGELVGNEKFDMLSTVVQDFGAIKEISPIFLLQEERFYIKKVDIDTHTYSDGKLMGYDPKVNIYDNFVSSNGGEKKRSESFFKAIEQTGNKKGGEENSLFKKTSYLLNDGAMFAFYLEIEYELKRGIVTLGADGSKFMMELTPSEESLEYVDAKGYLTLLSDSYITVAIKEHCDFAIVSEISHRNLKNKKHVSRVNRFEKSETLYLYEKGSVFINPSAELIADLNNKNLQQIGYNIYTLGEEN